MNAETDQTKGSQKWMQILVNEFSHLFNQRLASAVEWRSPLEEDAYKEYQDDAFLEKLGLRNLQQELSEFWPSKGPVWDALGRTQNQYFLVEAKAHVSEIISSCSARKNSSKQKIMSAVSATQTYLNVTDGKNWLDGFYQYANRLCHLYFLREICKKDAYLVFVYFCNDFTFKPTSMDEWAGALNLQKTLMGIKRHKLQKYTIELFVDVNDLI